MLFRNRMPPFMTHRIFNPGSLLRRGALLLLAVLLPAAFSSAQESATGSISGRVLNPATREFVRDAEIRVEGTTLLASSESGGYYTLPRVPAGPAKLTVSFAGYPPVSQTITVVAGTNVARDLELAPPAEAPGAREGVVKMGAFVISSGAEGQAKQIMNQRNSMSLGTSVSSDLFGDVTEDRSPHPDLFLEIHPRRVARDRLQIRRRNCSRPSGSFHHDALPRQQIRGRLSPRAARWQRLASHRCCD